MLANVADQFDRDEGITHDDNYINGAAEGLLMSLHNALLLRDGTTRRYYRTALSHNRALQCAVLVTAIEMMLRGSSDTLEESLGLSRKHLSLSLPKLVELFISWEGGDAIRISTLSSTIKIIRRVGPICHEAIEGFIDGLLGVLGGYMGSAEIHVEAALAIAFIFDQQDRAARRKKVIDQIQSHSSLIISTLSTAVVATSNREKSEEILVGLFNFAVNSHAFRTKMAKRRCTILAIGNHISCEHVESRKLALNICKCLLNDHMQTSCEPARLDQNTELLLNKVVESALYEKETMLQQYAISLLGDAAENLFLQPEVVEMIMGTLRDLAESDGKDEVVMEAAVTFASAVGRMHRHCITKSLLVDLADFCTLPFARARQSAIAAIDHLAADDGLSTILLAETEMLENFSLIISYGSDDDCTDAMHVIRMIAGNVVHHHLLCQSSSFLHALVQLVTKGRSCKQELRIE